MNISANFKAWLSVAMAVLGVVASGMLKFPDSIPDATQHVIIQWDAFVLGLFTAANAVLHWLPDTNTTGAPK